MSNYNHLTLVAICKTKHYASVWSIFTVNIKSVFIQFY